MSGLNKIAHSKCAIGSDDVTMLVSQLKTGMLTSGSLNQQFEEELSKMLSQKYVRLSTSGTMAFFKILLALEVKEGDEVLLPDYICNSLLGPIKALGGKVILYDNSANSWLGDIKSIMDKISVKTKVLVINHTFGFPFHDIKSLTKVKGVKFSIVEDCCHALTFQSTIGNVEISRDTLCSFYSFNATKMIATGEGGAISTSNESFAIELDKVVIGDQLSDLSCSLGLSQLKKFSSFMERRLEIADVYNSWFNEFRPVFFRKYPSAFFRYPIIVNDTKAFDSHPAVTYRMGIDSLLSFHLTCISSPKAYDVITKTISLPIYPALTMKEVNVVVEATKRILVL